MKKNRLALYIVINIIVSAVTTLAVLIIWNQMTRGQNIFCSSSQPTPIVLASLVPTYPSTSQPVLQIENVFGAGQLNDEMVVIKRVGEGDLSLAGWKLMDEQNNSFTFPPLTISKGTLNVYSRSGVDTVKDLFWNQKKAVWQTGKKVKILDPLGNVRSTYTIP